MTTRPTKLLMYAGSAIAAAAAVVVVLFVASFGVLATTQVNVPESVRSAVLEHVRNALGGADGVEFGSVAVSVDPRRVLPEISLENVRLGDLIPSWSVTLNEVTIGIEFRSLLNGEVRPSSVAISGVDMRRVARSATDEDLAAPGQDQGAAGFLNSVSSAFGFAEQAGLGRVTVTNARILDEDRLSAVGLSGGWLSMTGTAATKQFVGGFSINSDFESVGNVRFEGEYNPSSGTSEIKTTLGGIEINRLRDQLDWLGEVPQIDAALDGTAELRIGRTGNLEHAKGSVALGQGYVKRPSGTGAANFNSVLIKFEYDPNNRRVDFADVAIDFDAAVVKGGGHLSFVDGGDSGGWIEGQLDPLELTPSKSNSIGLPRPGISVSTAFRIDRDPYLLRFVHTALRSGDVLVLAEGEVGFDNGNLFGKAEFGAESLGLQTFFDLWPAGLADNPRNWLTKNLSGGKVQDISGAISYSAQGDWTTRLNFQFEDGAFTYLPTLPPAIEVAGYAELTNRSAAFGFERGFVDVPGAGRVNLSGSDMFIPNIWNGRDASRIRLKLSGGLEPVLLILNYPPYRLLDKGGINPTIATAHASAEATIKLPLLRRLGIADVEFDVKGGISDVKAVGISGKADVAADFLSVSANRSEVAISGVGTINGVQGSASWRQGFGVDDDRTSLLVGRIIVSQDMLNGFGIAVPEGILPNGIGADYYVSITPGAPAQFGITANLADLGFDIPLPQLGSEAANSPELLLEGRFLEKPELTRISISGAGINAEGSIVTGSDGGNLGIDFSNLKIGNWFDVALHIRADEKGNFRFSLEGGVIDLSKLPDKEAGMDGLSGLSQTVAVRLDKLIFNSRVTLTDLVGEMQLDSNIGGRLTGRINGGQLVGIEVASTANGMGGYIVTEDAGAAMRDGGVVTGLHGGQLELSLLPKSETGAYSGQLRMVNATVRDMPTLSEILSIVSIVGLVEQLTSQGISFSEIEAQFDVNRELLVLKEGTAIGPSIGMKMSGTWNTEDSTANLEGVITPFNPVSEFARKTPLQLIGLEKGSGFGAIAFSVSGPTDSPIATANPLTAITPGFLRDLFNF